MFFALVLPRITPFAFEDNPVHEGQFAQISCSASEGDLPLTMEWTLNSQSIRRYSEIAVSNIGKRTSILVIESVSYTHAGNYTCTARNAAGGSSYTAELLVNGF